jgi:hypothetical protein
MHARFFTSRKLYEDVFTAPNAWLWRIRTWEESLFLQNNHIKRIEKTENLRPLFLTIRHCPKPKEVLRQGENQESTSNNRAIRVTVNGDPRGKQLPAFFSTELTKVGQRTLQGSLQRNRTQQPAAAHNQKRKSPYTNKARSCTHRPSAKPPLRATAPPGFRLEPLRAVWRPAAAVSMRDRKHHCTTDSWRYTLAKGMARWCPVLGKRSGWLQRGIAWPGDLGINRTKVSKEIARNTSSGQLW